MGVNRSTRQYRSRSFSRPHARGGKPSPSYSPPPLSSRPHARGGKPPAHQVQPAEEDRRPHARGGKPYLYPFRTKGTEVVPTHVGVNRQKPSHLSPPVCRPHARGGKPPPVRCLLSGPTVVPTHVGVNRRRRRTDRRSRCRPHARGGKPRYWQPTQEPKMSSPRTWG